MGQCGQWVLLCALAAPCGRRFMGAAMGEYVAGKALVVRDGTRTGLERCRSYGGSSSGIEPQGDTCSGQNEKSWPGGAPRTEKPNAPGVEATPREDPPRLGPIFIRRGKFAATIAY